MPELARVRYSKRDIELSKQIYVYLVANLTSPQPAFVTYKQVGDARGVFHRTIRGALYYIQDRCKERGWPTLTVWVVRKDSGLPGRGCDVVEWPEVKAAAEACKKIDWPKEPWW